jgi:hypothetical protein
MYKPQPPTYVNKFKTTDVTLIIPTIDTDEEAMHEAMRSWFLNEPYEIIIVTAGEDTQKELQRIASTSVAASITRVLKIDKPHKRFQLVHGTFTPCDTGNATCRCKQLLSARVLLAISDSF